MIFASMKKKSKSTFFNKLRKKYTVVVHNEITYEEKSSFSISPLNIISLIGVFVIFICFCAFLMFSYTPMKYLFPWFDDKDYRQTALENQAKVDSLQKKFIQYDKYISDLKTVISGDDFPDTLDRNDTSKNYVNYQDIEFTKSEEDSLLRLKMEQFNDAETNFTGNQNGMRGVLFFSPIKGTVSQSFLPAENHWGVDVVGKKDEPIKAVLDGKVIYSGWSTEDGYVILISHGSGFVSVYKHNSSLFKKVGEEVKSGDAIAIIGNTGKHSSGPHLHFELWQNDKPLDPQLYISFD